jgi:GntR family transcriptional regulator
MDPVLYIQSAAYQENGHPIRFTQNYFREGRYEYVAEMFWDKPK